MGKTHPTPKNYLAKNFAYSTVFLRLKTQSDDEFA